MPRPGASRAVEVLALLAGAAAPAAVLATAALLPPADLAGAGFGWLPAALALLLAATATLLAGACLVIGLRTGAVAALAGGIAAAAVAGGGLSFALTGLRGGLVTALAAGSGLLLVALLLSTRSRRVDRAPRLLLAGIGLLLAEAAVLGGILPVTRMIGAVEDPLLVMAAALAVAAAAVAPGRWSGIAAAATALGAVALLLDREGGLEAVIGLLALVTAATSGLRAVAPPDTAEATGPSAPALPPLAHHLRDAVLHFDGSLRLRDWNAVAATLLGLDATARGTRLEDLLGVELADLPAVEGATLVSAAVGGIEIRLHRSGEGVVAVVGETRTRGDDDRLGRELRGTIEELLQARRTIELQRAEIERSAAVDLLTGVASRGAILDRLRIEIAQARRYQHPVAALLLDIDDFAAINHRHGVRGGDALLREVALRMRLRVREADALGRAGSDGFLAILPHTDEAGAATFAAALRHRLAQRPVSIGEELVPLSVSVGVAVMRAGEELDLDGLLARVGEALESARSAGGDRIALDREHGFLRLAPDDERHANEAEHEAN